MRAIYVITNARTGREYFGLTSQYQKRILQHYRDLRHFRHYNPKMSADAMVYGAESFKCAVLLRLDEWPDVYRPNDLEHRIIATMSRQKECYNTTGNCGYIGDRFEEAFVSALEEYTNAKYTAFARFVLEA